MRNMLLSIVFLLLAAGCGGKVSFSIENPTDTALALQIDETAIAIPPHQSKEITLKAGEHSMEAPAIGKIKFIVYAEREGGIINPTLSDFVIVSEAYTTGEEKRKNFRPSGGGPFQLDGVTFNGPFTLVNSLFIEKAWRFGVQEPFPDSLRGHDAGSGGNIMSKVFTAAGFVGYFEKQTEQAGFFEKNRRHIAAEPRKLSPPPPLPDFADPELQRASMKLRELYRRHQQATDPAEQKKLLGEHHKLVMEFVEVAGRRSSSQSVEENVKYNDFVLRGGQAMGQSAQIKWQ